MKTYEALFLADSAMPYGAEAVENSSEETKATVEQTVQTIMEKAGAKINDTVMWGNRKLAYYINKQTRGIYYAVYFECDPLNVNIITQQVNISTDLNRVMITEDLKQTAKANFELFIKQAQEAKAETK